MCNLKCFNTTSLFLFISWEVCKNKRIKTQKDPFFFKLSADIVTLSHGQGQWKWYKIAEKDCGYKHGILERSWLKSLPTVPNATFLSHKMYSQLDGSPNIIIQNHATCTDQKCILICRSVSSFASLLFTESCYVYRSKCILICRSVSSFATLLFYCCCSFSLLCFVLFSFVFPVSTP